MITSLQLEKLGQPALATYDSSVLDLVFAMDCTDSIGPYIVSATENIRSVVEENIVSEKSDIYLALVQYRDDTPQDSTFVTRIYDLTSNVNVMKGWLEKCRADGDGGGDAP